MNMFTNVKIPHHIQVSIKKTEDCWFFVCLSSFILGFVCFTEVSFALLKEILANWKVGRVFWSQYKI